MSLAENAELGALWLDRTRPGWASLIKLASLEMSSCSRCIAGQIFGSYLAIIDEYRVDALKLGFTVSQHSEHINADYAELKRVWTLLVQNRLSKEEKEKSCGETIQESC